MLYNRLLGNGFNFEMRRIEFLDISYSLRIFMLRTALHNSPDRELYHCQLASSRSSTVFSAISGTNNKSQRDKEKFYIR